MPSVHKPAAPPRRRARRKSPADRLPYRSLPLRTDPATTPTPHRPTSADGELVWWLDRFGEEGIDTVVDQLVISCALSGEAAQQAYELMASWVTRGKVEVAIVLWQQLENTLR